MNSLDYLLSFQRFGIKLGLDNIRYLLDRMGNPHRRFPAIHVAGTNGKGSIVAFIHSALVHMGYKVGRYTSPHLVHFSERIVVNHTPISDAETATMVDSMKPFITEMNKDARWGHPTYFEAVTALAFQYFAQHKVDFGVIEVGMGGRYDSTNVVDPSVSVISNVSMEHKDYLGDTIEKISVEKAGIIKPGVEVVTAVEQPEVRRIIDEKAGECNAPTYYLSRDFGFSRRPGVFPRQYLDFSCPWETLKNMEINLAGLFQAKNAAVALMALEVLGKKRLISFDESTLREGFARTEWPGRIERLADHPALFLDVAHNPAAMLSMVEAIEELLPKRRIILVVGMLKDKDVRECLRTLRRLTDTIIVTQPEYERAMPADQLSACAAEFFENLDCEKSISQAMSKACSLARENDIILVTGSLFNVAEVREFVTGMLSQNTVRT